MKALLTKRAKFALLSSLSLFIAQEGKSIKVNCPAPSALKVLKNGKVIGKTDVPGISAFTSAAGRYQNYTTAQLQALLSFHNAKMIGADTLVCSYAISGHDPHVHRVLLLHPLSPDFTHCQYDATETFFDCELPHDQ